jgi:CoA:oxalate CoA-transferase
MSGPLSGLRVLDFSWVLAGPYSTMLLADLGAEIIKVEAPGTGDTVRVNGPFINGISSYFLSINRGKKSITLNAKSAKGKEIIFELVKKSDVLVENFRPGVMENMGLGYDAVKEVNPQIIYASVSGFGQTGPYKEKPAYDLVIQAMGGIMSITGEPNGPPVRVGISIGDIAAGIFTATAILAALHESNMSKKGQKIDIAMLDCMVALIENACARYFATGEIPRPEGSRHPVATPVQAFPSKDGYVILAVGTDEQWQKFCKVIERMDLATDSRFEKKMMRRENREALEAVLEPIMRQRTTEEWITFLDKSGIVAGPVKNIDQVVNDVQVISREMVIDVAHKRCGKLKVVGSPFKFSRTKVNIESACPDLGEHTEEVLNRLLGIEKEEIENYRKENVL